MERFFFVLVLANHLLGLLLFRNFTGKEVEVNAAMIKADGSADTLKDAFHKQRTWLRICAWALDVLIGTVPAVILIWLCNVVFAHNPTGFFFTLGELGWSIAALGVLLAGYFLRTFSPSLNHAMQLDYKSRFYVSLSATASYLDRFVVWVARKLYGADNPALKDKANSLFQLLLNIALAVTLAGYVLLLVPLWCVVGG